MQLSSPATGILRESLGFGLEIPPAVPANALLNEDGTPIRNEDGSFILLE